jgi:uncharacterized membrane protein YbhN (UPF0104 family)
VAGEGHVRRDPRHGLLRTKDRVRLRQAAGADHLTRPPNIDVNRPGRPSLLSVAGLLRLARAPIVRALFVVIVLVLLAVTLVQRGPALWREVGDLSVPVALAAFVAALGGLLCSLMVWRSVLADLGSRLSLGDAVRVIFIGQLAKYVPGSVWPMLGQMELAADRGVPRARTAVSVMLSSAVMVWTGGLVAAVILPFVRVGSAGRYLWVLLAAPVIVVLLSPPVLNRSLKLVLRLMRRPSLYQAVTLRGLAVSTWWAMAGWSLNGLMIYVLVGRLAGHDGPILAASIAGYALSWVAGFLFVIAPAGAGVREAVLIAILSTQTTAATGLTVALVARGLAVVADALAGAAAGAMVGRRRLRALRSTAAVNQNPNSER